jgi:hypothetical protein
MKYEFKHVDGRIIMVTTLQIWGGDVTNEYDVTDKLMKDGVVDDYLDFHLGLLPEYKMKTGKITYTGEGN